MKAAFNRLKNATASAIILLVVCIFFAVWVFAAVFHGVNYLSGAKR